MERDDGEGESSRSNYSSAWETSDSEHETIDDFALSPGPSTLSEDNQSKMSQQGAKGRGILSSSLRKSR